MPIEVSAAARRSQLSAGHPALMSSGLLDGGKLDTQRYVPVSQLRHKKFDRILFVGLLAAVCALAFPPVHGKGGGQANATTRLRVEVSGGDSSAPVDAASVYVRFVIKHKVGKDEKVEMNMKTNEAGFVNVPDIPRGEVTIQVVADRWKPFGQKYQATEDEQTIKIHLEKPQKWY